MSPRQAAFTLIELLVVLAIVAVLAGLILPVFSLVQENARTLKCQNNLRQIGIALLAYAGDGDGTLGAGLPFPYKPPATRTRGEWGWTERLEPYLGLDRQVFTCPSSPAYLPENKVYGYFLATSAGHHDDPPSTIIKLSRLQAPSRYLLAGDITAKGSFAIDDAGKSDIYQEPAFAQTPAPFHRGKVNILFADGHVAAFAAFDPTAMTTHYDLKPDGTGYSYGE